MPAEIESMFYTSNEANGRFVPWHKLGTPVLEAPTSKDALRLAGLDWTVESHRLKDANTNVEIPDFFVNTRSSDNKPLGIVKGRYTIIQNKDAFDFTDGLIGEEARYETAGSLRDGKTIWLLANTPKTKVLDDEVAPFICFTNSFDGGGAVRCIMTPVRVVCNNTLNFALNTARRSWSARHTNSISSKMEDARTTLGLSKIYMEALNKKAEELSTYHIDQASLDRLTKALFQYKEDATDRVKENMENAKSAFYACYLAPDLANYLGTGWGVVNAMADFVDHRAPTRNTQNFEENRWSSIMNGNTLLDTCYDMVCEGV